MEIIIVIIIIVVVLVLFFSSNLDLRFRGKKSTGRVIDSSSRTWTDQYGVSHTSYTTTYDFQAEDGNTYRGTKSTGSRRVSIGTSVTVYYSPKNPNRNDATF